ncbi:Ankyrin repeat domain protein [Wolbachia endosymbiont of Drosophila simulans wNo]|uniref:ankyrin repeat domain-containing protein n=1 Tax=unclassified Wolbachia TaxID=2640676 RepID=UPI0002D256F9|nr:MULTISPECIES: ankyrin repeat domain-containing protein [unclassified Wolbachia]AGJ98777.1 Ankyrin repeat domain protein [Wolbachia endosymbiont of Drosophila simulans wNo]QCB62968.1 ankyrin repeat domain-containing protein [Wolbachia endosymbiont of Drosophila mauritiana]QCB64013.1 ankyrin repeat domain-containing protein [Wolbachia endosymbiont of Drosophila mauritiana]QWE33722.1 Ankyrin repeat domain protein [Wolbachia endosymbiont of Drosophila simulans]TGB06167.1 ankyrin repeat domain-c
MNEREQRELDELLMNSSKGENIQQITELIEAGANINAVKIEQKETPLHIAIRYGHKEVAEFLLNEGANINALERRKWTPLHTAVKSGKMEVAELLLDRGANVNAVDNLDMTPLHFALKYNREELVRLLLDRGANVNSVDKKGRTPLSIVASDDYQIGYCDKPMVVRTIIAYAVVHSGITTKPECIVKNIELSKFWDDYQNEMMNIKLNNSNISLYQFLRENDENKLAGYLSDREYDEIRCSDKLECISEFPEHADKIVSQFDKSLARRDLLDKSRAAIENSNLQVLCQVFNEITYHLTDKELKNIIEAFPSQNLDNPSAEQLQGASQVRHRFS